MGQFTSLEESIFFYTWNDYAIIKSIFHRNCFKFQSSVKTSIECTERCLDEYKSGTRIADNLFDYKKICSLKNRLFENPDSGEVRNKYFEIAQNDISNIFNAMRRTSKEIMLYRTISAHHDSYDYTDNPNWVMKSIISTSPTPYKEDKWWCNFYRLEITVPENNFILELDHYETHNERGEFLLPPSMYKITNIREGNNERCKGIVEVEVLEQRMCLQA